VKLNPEKLPKCKETTIDFVFVAIYSSFEKKIATIFLFSHHSTLHCIECDSNFQHFGGVSPPGLFNIGI
jgi:hypothetical protein